VDEVLRGEPGLAITQGGAYGLGWLYLRGAGGQGLMTLDGLPVPDSLPGIANLNALLLDGLQHVEVDRGFGPASQPFSSLGGAIRMTSRDAFDKRGDLRVEGGSFGFLKETLRGNLAGERGRLAITANRSDAFDGAWHAQQSNGNPERDPFHGRDRYGIRNGALAMVDAKGAFFAEEIWMVQNSLKARLTDDWSTRLQLWAIPRPAIRGIPWE
jgi:vitamin B12 transporter